MQGGHHHSHSGHSHGGLSASGSRFGSAASRHRGRLAWALALTLGYMTAEVIGGLITGSLALLADAAHMLADAGGLALALFAIRFAERPATPQKTFGYLRAEILAASLNALLLLMISSYILYEAYRRLVEPNELLAWPMLAVAVIGLAVNLVCMRLLVSGSAESLNVRGAYLEVFSDMLGSVGVIAAALVVMLTGWTFADPLVGAGIALFIVPRTWRLLSQAVHILLEGVPAQVDIKRLERVLCEIPGVGSVHDVHVWTITSGLDSMSGHLVVEDMAQAPAILRRAREAMHESFRLDHVTIQIEDGQNEDGTQCEENCHFDFNPSAGS